MNNPTKPQADKDEMEITELQADIARAKKRGKERAEAPPITVNERFKDPRFALADRCKEPGMVLTNSINPNRTVKKGDKWVSVPAPKATHRPFFGDRKLHNDYINMGYVPMTFKGEHVKCQGGDPGYFIPIEISQRDIGEGVQLAKSRSAQRKKEEKAEGVVDIENK